MKCYNNKSTIEPLKKGRRVTTSKTSGNICVRLVPFPDLPTKNTTSDEICDCEEMIQSVIPIYYLLGIISHNFLPQIITLKIS